ncbi:MAG: guanylate cyclase [Actinomycetota bacterium]|nr:MAG: guanylate cyclase [Actinomycetota bacterium]
MPRFMDVHRGMEGITEELLKQAHDADLEIQHEEGVNFEQAWADPSTGLVFCLSEAPSREAVQRIHERAGHPTDEVYEVPIIV